MIARHVVGLPCCVLGVCALAPSMPVILAAAFPQRLQAQAQGTLELTAIIAVGASTLIYGNLLYDEDAEARVTDFTGGGKTTARLDRDAETPSDPLLDPSTRSRPTGRASGDGGGSVESESESESEYGSGRDSARDSAASDYYDAEDD